jgi:hypothetical protein
LPSKRNDIRYLLATQSTRLQAIIYDRCTELATRLTILLATLLKTKVPRCEVTNQETALRRQDCVWPCQIQAIVHFAADLSIKLEQRSFKTFFHWPESGKRYDRHVMEDESDLRSNAVVNMTYMPAVIDEHDWKDPHSIDHGVWYKASVSLR